MEALLILNDVEQMLFKSDSPFLKGDYPTSLDKEALLEVLKH